MPAKGASAPGAQARLNAEPASACPQLLANAIIFLCGNLTGAFHKHQLQDASRDLFTYTVKCIQIRRKLRIEKRQQVGFSASALSHSPSRPSARPRALRLFPGDVGLLLSSVSLGRMAGHPCRTHPRGLPGTREDVCTAGRVASREGGCGGQSREEGRETEAREAAPEA